ncbi:hypothetical protein [Leucobacter chromiireducens]|uniref:DUF4190 domain-containing protein n=1 Tax=Leucobacter chromiireducens subsp. solipictus TaxID=398235 RepID=A0ABS1SCK2_9MICO|nr:hypothetical protein [Leucobacter chromiireducens]MBL3677777.1 hypothetical protein [Leucobacter chromiireducens subsp. solipictus]
MAAGPGTHAAAEAYGTRAATSALTSGIASIVLLVLFFTPWFGAYLCYASIALGAFGVVVGIGALRRRQPKRLAVTGLVLGSISAVVGIGLIVFALVFGGAIQM